MTSDSLTFLLLLSPVLLFGYAYFGYPAILWLLGRLRRAPVPSSEPDPWPLLTIILPAYNEARSIAATVEALLALDYPADRRQIIVVSDASTDGTDDIVRRYRGQGVELLRVAERGGKTAAENAVLPLIRGAIVVNTDATIRILPGSLKPLIRAFQDPTVGVASGRDVSVADLASAANAGESGYVGYEMWVRSLETRLGSIVGASGCFYAIRVGLHRDPVPPGLSRDFAAALTAREHGFRAVSVNDAVCLVPRTASLQREYRRKTRTMARGLQTLWFKRRLLNPFVYGIFAWMLWSHKLIRWLVFLAAPVALLALLWLSREWLAARVLTGAVALAAVVGMAALRTPEHRRMPRLVTLCGFVLASCAAGALAWLKALRGESSSIWEPTRRTA